jgi:putative endonuclease
MPEWRNGIPACPAYRTGRRQAGAHKINMYYTYAIKSIDRNYIYVGLTDNPERRVRQHNNCKEKTTRAFAPFNVILIEKHESRIDARKREKYLKSGCGKEYLKNL